MIALLSALALAADFDHAYADLDAFYDGAVHPEGVDYGALAARRPRLDRALAAIAAAPVDTFDRDQQLALYVNAYNGYTVATVLDAMPLSSITALDGGKVWDTRRFQVGGRALTLNEMEHQRIRKLGDARVHAVVNCASRGCPPLPEDPLRPDTLDAQLTAAARAWAATNAVRVEGGTAYLSRVFDWYADDFAPYRTEDLPGVDGKAEAAFAFLLRYAPPALADRLRSGELTAAWADYDWSLNAR